MSLIRNSNVQEHDDRCGSVAGYKLHQRRLEKPCPECKTAWRGYISKYRAKKGRR